MEDTRDAMKSVRYDLVLDNRVLDENGSSGLELIRAGRTTWFELTSVHDARR